MQVVEMPVLGVTYEGNGNTLAVEEGDEIRTEAGDDRISVWNYVAFGIAGVVILVAAAFSKQIYRALTKGRSKTPGSSDGRRSRAKTRHYPGDLEAAKDAPGSSRPSANALPEPERPSSKQIRVAPAPVVVSGGETAQPRPNLGGPIGMAGGMVRVEQSASANVGRGGQRGRTAGGAREGPRAPRNEANNRNVYAAGPMLL